MKKLFRRVILFAGTLVLLATLAIGWLSFEGARTFAFEGEASNLDALVEGWTSLPSVPGTILHITGGDTALYSKAAGFRSKKGRAPLTPETPFHTASVGKLFTAVTVLRLHERGVLDIDRPAADYLGPRRMSGLVVIDGIDFGDKITLRHLLSHRSGIGNTDDDIFYHLSILLQPQKRKTPDDLLAFARRAKPAGPPGEQFSYASPGFWLLGLVIEAATNEPYHKVVRREVFDRLGMSQTVEANFEWDRKTPWLHHYFGRIDLSVYDPSVEFADGGFQTTASDLVTFSLALARGELFEETATQALFLTCPEETENPRSCFGLGPGIERPESGPLLYRHGGHWGVRLVIYPEDEVVAVMTLAQTNVRASHFWMQARALVQKELGVL